MRIARSLSLALLACVAALALAGCDLITQTPVREVVTKQPGSSPAAQKPAATEGTGTEPVGGTEQTSSAPDPADSGVKLDSDSGEKFGYLTKVWKADGAVYVTVDYAQMLTGDAAAKEAAKRGDESPPPNDYYIVNDNTKLRTFRLKADAKVGYQGEGDAVVHPLSGASAFLAKWDETSGQTAVHILPYKLTVDGNDIMKLEQVFLP